MAQIFHRGTNPLSKASIFGAVFIIAAVIFVFDLIYKSPYINEAQVIREQPVPFSHKHHVKDIGIACVYCHTSVENSSFAGFPSAQTCMSCHSQIWTNAAMLEPIRKSYETGMPVRWARVNALPDYAYFNHSIHVTKGISCVTCHGPVGDMPLSWRNSTLQMKWCMDCHRNPEKFIQPRETVLSTDSPWADNQSRAELQRWLMQEYHVKKYTDCTTCHR